MDNSHRYSTSELQKCPLHSQQNVLHQLYAGKDNSKQAGRPDESGTDPNRYEPAKFEKGSNENSGGDGSTESAAEQLDNL